MPRHKIRVASGFYHRLTPSLAIGSYGLRDIISGYVAIFDHHRLIYSPRLVLTKAACCLDLKRKYFNEMTK